ncbi:MAG: acyltransferase [Actinomycetota bacterium]|nr:acyltransferase [Actinomycetota bacterium]
MATAERTAPTGAQALSTGRRPARHRPNYFPGLDGIRALAVGVVVAYHVNLTWAKGGFLGVDAFFVLSGFLITGLLLKDADCNGHLQLKRFWRRRARRLLPAVGVLLVAVVLVVPLLAPDEGHRIGGDLVAALTYVTNWRLIFSHQSYFESIGRPPLLQHLWSLAVEEQFYLLWPLVLAVALRWNRRRQLLAPWIFALAVISTVIMVLLYDPEVDPSRVYYGTDTRMAAIFVGAALACVTRSWAARPRTTDPRRRAGLEVAGVVSLAFLAWCVAHVNQFDARLYRGGFLLVALAAAVVVAVAADRQRTLFGRVLGMRPLVWLGKRSYAIYLWFWPVLMLTRAHADINLSGNAVLAVQLAIIMALAATSYRFVEVPCRSGALGRAWGQWRAGELPLRTQWSAATVAGALVIVAVAAAVVYEPPQQRPLQTAARTLEPPGPVRSTDTVTTILSSPVEFVTKNPVVPAKVSAIGDSVFDDARNALAARIADLVLDAQLGRQTTASLTAARALRDSGRLGDEVILHVGNNGVVTKSQFDQFMEVFSGVRRVVVVNVRVPRPWEEPNNEILAEGVKRWPNAVLVDWNKLGSAHPDAFESDGVHLTRAGTQLLVEAIAAQL